jgi:hypothetical protein
MHQTVIHTKISKPCRRGRRGVRCVEREEEREEGSEM